MKLLVVGRTYLTAFAQAKYLALKELDPQLEIRLVMPPTAAHVFKRYEAEIAPGMSQAEIVTLPSILNRSHMTYMLNPFKLAALLKSFGPAIIQIEEDPHSAVGIETCLLARLVCPNAKISFFIWDNLAHKPKFPLNLVKQVLTRFSFSRCQLVICGNREGQTLLKTAKNYYGRSVVLPQLGLDPAAYLNPPSEELCHRFCSEENAGLIGFIGRLAPEKGLRLLFEALVRLQDLPWKLLVVGAGPLKGEIEADWKKVFGEQLIFLEAVPHDEVSGYLKCLDIFVLPSLSTSTWKEQFGLTLAQAMLAGVACIGSSSGAIPEVLGPGGLIFPEGELESLAQALETLLSSPQRRADFGEKGREFALQRYTNSAVAAGYLEAFRQLSG